MSDVEQPAAPDSEVVEQTASEPQEVSTEPTDTAEDSELELPAEPTEPEEEEVEYEGEKFKVPAKLKDALLRQADYTRKTQEVAQQRQSVEQEREQLKQAAQIHQQHIQEVAKLVAVDERLQQFANVNWNALSQEDPVQAQRLHIEFTQLQAQRGQLMGTLTQRQQQDQWKQQQETAKRIHEGEAYLKREFKDWSPEKGRALLKYGEEQGISGSELDRFAMYHPAIAKVLDKAARFDQLLKKQATKPKPEAQEAPVTRISATKAAPQVNPDKLSAEEWVKWRNAQIKRK